MARLRQNQRERATGMLTAGMSQWRVAQALSAHKCTISRLWRRSNDMAVRPPGDDRTTRITCYDSSAGPWRHIRLQHLRNLFLPATVHVQWLLHGFLAAITTGSAIRLCEIAFWKRGLTAVAHTLIQAVCDAIYWLLCSWTPVKMTFCTRNMTVRNKWRQETLKIHISFVRGRTFQ